MAFYPPQPFLSQTQPQQEAPAFNPLVDDQTEPIGPNNENLAKDLQIELWNLLQQQERQDEIPRRNEVCEILRRKLYYRDEQYWWYSADQGQWFPPTQAPLNDSDYQPPAFQHVTNIIRPFAESLQSVLSQNNTQAVFFPESAEKEEDVLTAQKATKARELIHQRNDWQNRVDEMTYYMCTDGFFGAYVRQVSDAEQFGTEQMTVYGSQEVPVGNPSVNCPSCGYQDEGTTDQAPTCPDCGEPMQDVPAPTAQVPVPVGQISLPKGQEVITIVPALNLRRTMWADHQCDFLYLEWVFDIHKAKAMSRYPHAADLIEASAGSYGDGGIANSYERIARRLLYLGTGRHTGMILQDLGVMRHAWIRPCVFELVKDDGMKAKLQQLFPNGAYVTFYNDVYCESRSECMDEYWETMHTCDGEGQIRPTLISSIIPVQDQLNDSINLLFEQNMNGVPEAFGDQNTIDFEARSQQTAAPGNMTPVDLQPGQDIRSKVLFGTAVEPAVALVNYIQELFGPIPQFITGAFPALFGGNTGSNDTASGIAIQRNQALGRLGRSWRRLQNFCANLDGKAVNCFQKNMTQDVEIPHEDQSGGYQSDWIRIEDMQGNVSAYPEVDAQYPTLQADVRGLLLSLLNEGNPLFLASMQTPENMEYLWTQLGLTDVQSPGEDQRKKTLNDIDQLSQEPPQTIQQPQQPGMPPEPPQMVPTVKPDALIDNLPVALATVQQWLRSDEGQQVKQSNPMGYLNVYSYAKAIDQLQKQAAFQQAVVGQAMAGNGPAADLGGAEHIQAPQGSNPNAPEPPSNAPSPSASQA